MIIDKTFVVENHGKFPSFFSAKYGGIAGILKCNQVNKGSPWFYEIISKIECIEIIIMMKSDSRQQPCKHNRSDYCISQHCISVIQAAVDRIVISSVQSGVQIVEIFFCCICFLNIYIGNILITGVLQDFLCTAAPQKSQSATLVFNFPFNQRQPYLIFGPLQTMVERSSNGMEKIPSSFIVCCTTWFWNWTTIRHVFCILQEFDAGANTVAQWLKKWRIFTR